MDITKRKITKIAREVGKFTVRTLREDGIGTAEFDVLHAIRKNPGITQAGVCRIVGIDKGAVARQTANLEAKGYLIRKENPGDGRSPAAVCHRKSGRIETFQSVCGGAVLRVAAAAAAGGGKTGICTASGQTVPAV